MTEARPPAGPAGCDDRDENIAKLLRMARQIVDFFAAYPEDAAAASVADHINKFWTARMRGDFLAAFAARPDDLPPLLRRALAQIRSGPTR